ncbi:MAG TPA: hypothetical protein VJB14_05580 [Planctomycetota bacterium]|nr:hypothetical protein [Planctomycetota bacterium]
MAIDKIESKKYEFTKEAMLQLGIAGVLVVASLVLGWAAFSKWRFKSSLVAGYRAYESYQLSTAKRELESAISWNPEHVGAREVLAKVLVDAGGPELSAAEGHYRKIRELGGDSSAAKVGMGVIYLKRAELATAPKEVQDLVAKATAEFQAASDLPEGNIGVGHGLLLLSQKLGNPKLLADARVKFEAARKELGGKSAARISRDGLIDYYSGLGRAFSTEDPRDLEVARDAFQSCMQLARRWETPRANMMALEGRQWAVWKGPLAEITALEASVNVRRKLMGSYWRDSRDQELFKKHARPWMAWSLAFAQALARAGNDRAAAAIFNEIRGNEHFKDFPEPFLAESRFHCDVVTRDGIKPAERENAAKLAFQPLDGLLKKLSAVDDAGKERKALAHNAMAVMRFLQGTSGYKSAQENLGDALKLFPEDYVYNRNLLVLLKRSKAPLAQMQPVLDKTKALATGAFAEDFEKVEKVLAEK